MLCRRRPKPDNAGTRRSSWEGTRIDAGSWGLHAGPRRDKKIKVQIKEFKKESRESRYDLRIRKSTNVDQKSEEGGGIERREGEVWKSVGS